MDSKHTNSVPDWISERFGIGEISSIRDAGGSRNVSFVVETDRGRWIVRRRYEGYSSPERIAFDHGALRHLTAAGAAVVPPREDVDGNTSWRDEAGLWEVYPFADGRHLREGDPNDLRALAEALAQFHEAGRSCNARYDKLGPRGEMDPDHLLESAGRIRAEDPEIDDALDPYEQAVHKASKALSLAAWQSLPHTLVHGDVQPANVLVDGGRVSAFLDLDWCAWRPRVYDLCFAILCCCAMHDQPIGGGDVWDLTQEPMFDARLVNDFLRAYESQSERLADEERAAMPAQTVLNWCHARVDNALKVPPADRRRFLTRGGEGLLARIEGLWQ